MTHLKTIAVSLIALAAVAVPASALDHREHETRHNQIKTHFGVDLNLGNIRISNYSPRYNHSRAQAPRVFIALEKSRRHNDRALNHFEKDIRRQFSRAAQRNFRLVGNPRRADILIRLDRDEWRKAYKHYSKANRKGRYEHGSKAVNRVTARLLERAYDIRSSSYRNVRYDRDERNDRHYDDRRDDHYARSRH